MHGEDGVTVYCTVHSGTCIIPAHYYFVSDEDCMQVKVLQYSTVPRYVHLLTTGRRSNYNSVSRAERICAWYICNVVLLCDIIIIIIIIIRYSTVQYLRRLSLIRGLNRYCT